MREFRDGASLVSQEPILAFNVQNGTYVLEGEPARYQWAVEMLQVMFPDAEVRVGLPTDYGWCRRIGLRFDDGTAVDTWLHFKDHYDPGGPLDYDVASDPTRFVEFIEQVRKQRNRAL